MDYRLIQIFFGIHMVKGNTSNYWLKMKIYYDFFLQAYITWDDEMMMIW